MKTKILISTVLILAGVACQDESDGMVDSRGIVPASMEQVVDIFELKYGEVKECVYNNQTFRFSIEDIEDNLLDCSVVYIMEGLDGVRIHAYLHVETDTEVVRSKVSSKICGPYQYRNDGSDIQHIQELLESWQSISANTDYPFVEQQFTRLFGEGRLLENTSLSVFMAKAYTQMDHHQENNKNLYKFIFIVTN
jgi:hypothetical protein